MARACFETIPMANVVLGLLVGETGIYIYIFELTLLSGKQRGSVNSARIRLRNCLFKLFNELNLVCSMQFYD